MSHTSKHEHLCFLRSSALSRPCPFKTTPYARPTAGPGTDSMQTQKGCKQCVQQLELLLLIHLSKNASLRDPRHPFL